MVDCTSFFYLGIFFALASTTTQPVALWVSGINFSTQQVNGAASSLSNRNEHQRHNVSMPFISIHGDPSFVTPGITGDTAIASSTAVQ